MGNSTIIILAIGAAVVLGLVFIFSTARRRDAGRTISDVPDEGRSGDGGGRLPVPVGGDVSAQSGRDLERAVALERQGRTLTDRGAPPPPALPPDEETLGVTRRQVLNRGIVGTMVLAISGFSASMIAMLWPTLSGGFGAKIRVGKLDEILDDIQTNKEPYYVGAGRFYLNPYPKEAVSAAKGVASYAAVVAGYDEGVVALYQKCPHLGCRVPWCKTSQWFECPCHGSQYNRVGEKKGGPAPRGMDRFVTSVEGGTVVVDTKIVIPGPPIGVNTTGQESEGPHCLGAVAEH
ncbi:MAG: ubiquinol-cytochrome c reductase iron-sulfur subunit [Acidimicrobiales bacterium]